MSSKRSRKSAAAANLLPQPETIPTDDAGQPPAPVDIVGYLSPEPRTTEGAPTAPTEETLTPAPVDAAPAAPTTEKKKPAVTPVKPLTGTTAAMKRLILADFTATPDEIAARLKDQHLTGSKSTIQTVRSDFLHSLKVLAELDSAKLRAILRGFAVEK